MSVTPGYADRGYAGRTFVLTAAMLGLIPVSLDVSIVNVAIGSVRQSFPVTIGDLPWVVTGYTLAYAVSLLSAGALSDRIGARAAFLAGFACFAAGSAGCGFAGIFRLLIAMRVVQGVGAALLVPSAMALLRELYPEPEKRAGAIALWAGAGSLSLAIGPVIGGAIVQSFGWRMVFFINLPVTLLGVWLTLRHAPRMQQSEEKGWDVPGQAIAALLLVCLTATVTRTREVGWISGWTLGGLVAALLFGTVLVLIEASVKRPMMPLGLFSNLTFSAASFVGFVVNFAFYGLIFVLSVFFQSVQGRSPLETGLAFIPMTGLIVPFNIVAGRLNARFGVRITMTAGLVLSIAGFICLLVINLHVTVLRLVPGFLLVGAGAALTIPSLMTAALSGMPEGYVGIGSGVHNAVRQVGGTIGVALFAALLNPSGANDFLNGMHQVMLISAAATLGALAVTLRFMRAMPQ